MISKEPYIYESPDGKHIYKRSLNDHERELVSGPEMDLFSYQALKEIKELAKTNNSVKKALDNLFLLYYTVKDDKNTS